MRFGGKFKFENIVVVQSLSHGPLFTTPWLRAHQTSLSFTISPSLLKLMSTESVMASNCLVLFHPLLLPSIFPSIRVFSNELAPIGSYISLVRVHFTFYHFLFSCSNSLLFEDKGYMTLVHWWIISDQNFWLQRRIQKDLENELMVKRRRGLSGARDRLDRFQCYIENR